MNFTFGQNTWYQITRVEGRNVHDKIAFGAFHLFLVAFQTNAGYIHATHNNNLEIRIVGSSSRPHNLVIAQNKTKYLNNQLYINTSESTDHRNEVTKNYWYSPNLNGASRVFLQNFEDFEMFCQSVIYHSVLQQWRWQQAGKMSLLKGTCMFSNILTINLTHLKYHMYVNKISMELNS